MIFIHFNANLIYSADLLLFQSMQHYLQINNVRSSPDEMKVDLVGVKMNSVELRPAEVRSYLVEFKQLLNIIFLC